MNNKEIIIQPWAIFTAKLDLGKLGDVDLRMDLPIPAHSVYESLEERFIRNSKFKVNQIKINTPVFTVHKTLKDRLTGVVTFTGARLLVFTLENKKPIEVSLHLIPYLNDTFTVDSKVIQGFEDNEDFRDFMYNLPILPKPFWHDEADVLDEPHNAYEMLYSEFLNIR